MPQPTGSFSSYDAVGNREDLSDVITNISPTDTPFTSSIGKVPATSTLHEWQTDSLAAVDESNAVIEGDDATTDAATPTVRLNNQTQILDKVARVTGSQRAANSAGRGDEMDYQVMKKGKELKLDLERRFLSNKFKVAGNDTTAREMAGAESWITTNADMGAGGANPTGDGSDGRTDGTQRAFTEAQLKSVLASCADEGGNPDTVYVGSANKQVASTFTGNARREVSAESQTLNAAVHIYVGDFGSLTFEYSRHVRPRTALVIDHTLWNQACYRDYGTTDLAKTGDTDRKQLLIETTLECKQEAGNGIIADLNS